MLFPDWQTLRAVSFCEEIYFSGLSYLEVAATYSHGEGELAMRCAGVFSAKVRTTWIQSKVPSPESMLVKAVIPEVVKPQGR